jgi:hypothetical protein
MRKQSNWFQFDNDTEPEWIEVDQDELDRIGEEQFEESRYK